ncbi:metalloregulator ArsR/SmtB family transcription factor [Thiotrichales bacterium 19S3-7]|nr:metalloregulator ArsR/SmtB family transcription factor [Thiotrichales bacterium 19S3-7]MCF6802898.1 metalloregulator ArsR/SmtB family transcription factor [Thiotrichales bacterium 19S3-11]
MSIETICTQLSALSQAVRLRAFQLLIQAGDEGITAGKLSEYLAIINSAVSFHIEKLQKAGLVYSEKKGRFIIYKANYSSMQNLINYLSHNCCVGIKNIKEYKQ